MSSGVSKAIRSNGYGPLSIRVLTLGRDAAGPSDWQTHWRFGTEFRDPRDQILTRAAETTPTLPSREYLRVRLQKAHVTAHANGNVAVWSPCMCPLQLQQCARWRAREIDCCGAFLGFRAQQRLQAQTAPLSPDFIVALSARRDATNAPKVDAPRPSSFFGPSSEPARGDTGSPAELHATSLPGPSRSCFNRLPRYAPRRWRP